MKISFIIPALKNTGPILVVRDIVRYLTKQYPNDNFSIFYFDQVEAPIDMACPVYWIQDQDNLAILFSSDIIHSHGIRPDYYVFKNRKKISGKCICTIHSLLSSEYRIQYNSIIGFLIEFVWSKIVKRHDAIVVLTEVMKEHYRKVIPLNKMTVINNGRNVSSKGIDQNDIEILNQFKGKYKILGIACVLTRRKGVQQVIEALPKLSDFAFVIIGDGPEKENLESLADLLGVRDRCLFLGKRSEGNRYNHYFDFYVFPSYMEGLPLSLLEGAAMGKAIICSGIDIHREIFTIDEVSFFQLDDIDSLIQAIKNADLRQLEFQTNVYKKYNERYTAQIMANSYYSLYSSLTR